MKTVKLTVRADRFGITTSALCTIHCAAMPLVIPSLPLWGLAFLAEGWVEWSIIGISMAIAGFSLGVSYCRHHRNARPAMLLLGGFLLIAAAHDAVLQHLEPVLLPLGGVCILLAHVINLKLTKQCVH
ncbi:MerC domain-containing protein [Hufsiella ginkgonis]|uniref:MerC family mercury resistance protein n=1 Tax=Hufsiella ginkgonis TaxID=2695274 RepID=A0A7K1XRY4_9SPHI|nr:MerC domain-containing protein [Hufsiella ginkgonis]MXV13748.1 MerC family mercury resistance protein [Hufsiella ginkgonis]